MEMSKHLECLEEMRDRLKKDIGVILQKLGVSEKYREKILKAEYNSIFVGKWKFKNNEGIQIHGYLQKRNENIKTTTKKEAYNLARRLVRLYKMYKHIVDVIQMYSSA